MDGHLHSYYSSLKGCGDDRPMRWTSVLDLCAGYPRWTDALDQRNGPTRTDRHTGATHLIDVLGRCIGLMGLTFRSILVFFVFLVFLLFLGFLAFLGLWSCKSFIFARFGALGASGGCESSGKRGNHKTKKR